MTDSGVTISLLNAKDTIAVSQTSVLGWRAVGALAFLRQRIQFDEDTYFQPEEKLEDRHFAVDNASYQTAKKETKVATVDANTSVEKPA